METFTLKLTQESADLFQYRPGAKIGPFKITKIIREYFVPKAKIIVECPDCNDRFTPFGLVNVKIIEFECSIN